MSDKSPRQSLSKKTGRSIKEKRADKREQKSAEAVPEKVRSGKNR